MRMKQVMSGTMKPMDYYDLVSSKVSLDEVMLRKHRLLLEKIPQTNVAMYQTVNLDDGCSATPAPDSLLKVEPMKREVDEVNKLAAKNDIVLGPDGRAMKLAEFRDNVTWDEFEVDSIDELLLLCHYEPEGDESNTPHECAICDARFATEKTLILHIQLKHISSTKVYQCPSCSQTFLQAALVIKHLSNDHKKSLKKIRSMRETIHKRHMRIDEVQVKGPSRELHRLQTDKERIEAENKAYLDNMANFDTTNQSMCTYCNKIFERKAVLTSHMVNCRIKFEKILTAASNNNCNNSNSNSSSSNSTQYVEGKTTIASTSGGAAAAAAAGPAKRGPKPKENCTKEKELIHDENSSSTVISSDGSNEGGAAAHTITTNGDGTAPVPVKRKRKLGAGKSQGTKKVKKEEQQPSVQTTQPLPHSKLADLLEKEFWTADQDDRDDSYFSFDDKAPEDARDETFKRRFPCDICNKDFSTMSNLKRHNVMFHYFQNRYTCCVCNSAAMKKKDAMAHLREVHKVDKEEHEMKALLRQEKNEVRIICCAIRIKDSELTDLSLYLFQVSSSEVLDLDLDETSSHQDPGSTAMEGDPSRTNSPVPSANSTASTAGAATFSTPPESMAANNSNSSGVGSSPSTVETPVRKRGRPKGSIKKPRGAPPPVDRELRTDSAAKKEVETSAFAEFQEVMTSKKKPSPMTPAPPQLMDTNSSSSSATSSRPIRNRTKPKDKDFVYDLKGDYIYEDEAMDTALSESILSASSMPNCFSGTATVAGNETSSGFPPSQPDRITKKRCSSTELARQLSSGNDSNGEVAPSRSASVASKRSVGRPPKAKNAEPLTRPDEMRGGVGPFKSKCGSNINWEKNVMIPTRIIEHRHSVDHGKGGLAHLKKGEVRRNSVEVMTKNGSNVKENNRPGGGSSVGGPLGMYANIMETSGALARDVSREEESFKDFSHADELRRFVATTAEAAAGEELPSTLEHHHVLLNGRSLGEILSMSTNGIMQQPGAAAVED